MRALAATLLGAVPLVACGCSGTTAIVSPPSSDPLITPLYAIQGNGPASPLDGQDVTVRGVVTGDFQDGDADTQNELGGFYLQEEYPDADPATSDAVFVFDGSTPGVDVMVGDRVTVEGTVHEYFGETQISAARVGLMATSAATIGATEVSLPAAAIIRNSDGGLIADLERYEGMLVRFSDVLTVADLSGLERYGEILLSQGGRLTQYTNEHAPDVAGYAAHRQQVAARCVMLDDGQARPNTRPVRYLEPFSFETVSYPAIRVGDTISKLTGNVRFARGSGRNGTEIFRLVPTSGPSFRSVNARPDSVPVTGGSLRVAGVNMDNYFTTIDTGQDVCGPSGNGSCRGANTRQEFDRQFAKVIAVLILLHADIIGLTELENNASASLQSLTDGLNTVAGAGTYAFVDTGTIGSESIKVGFLYKTASVSTKGAFAILDANTDQRFDDSRNRPSLAQSFVQHSNGAILTIAVNHFKSKSSSCTSVGDPDRNDGQGNCNLTRSDAAGALADWLAADPTGSGDPDVLIIGDLNAHLQEDPVTRLEAAGFENLADDFIGSGSYSYVFVGEAGALDHALASPTLAAQATGTTEWHINADEAAVHDYNLEFGRDPGIFDGTTPYRASDHDPIVVGLRLTN